MAEIMDVNLDRLKRGENSLLSGRKNGEKAYEYFKLNDFTKESVIRLKSSGSVVITNSYFLGMLEAIFKKYDLVDDLYKHLDYSDLSELNKEELIRGIKRGFAKNKSPFG